MQSSETISLLRSKIVKILTLLLLIRLGLYIPVPNIDLNLFESSKNSNIVFGFAKTLTGSSFLGIGSLGILPYINSSILIQLLTSVFPSLERLQKEEGELGRQKINRYTRYLTFGWAIFLSAIIAFGFVKPLVFNWSLFLALKIILSLTTGSLLSMWFAELITEEGLGNGSSMIIFINIIGSIPNSFKELTQKLAGESYGNNILFFIQCSIVYLFIVLIIVIFQYSYKKIVITSAKQLNWDYNDQTSQSSEL
jgi:preprotein translocase subunit SecY